MIDVVTAGAIKQIAVDKAVADSKSLDALKANLQPVDPSLAQQLIGKALIASRTPWGILVAYIISWVASRYGLGLDADMTSVLSGVIILAASYGMRYVTKAPITSLVKTPTPPSVEI